jgi:hypothetical protein
MIDEPVQNACGDAMKLNSAVDQSAQMLRDHRQGERELQHEIAIARHIEAVGRHTDKPQPPRHVESIDRQARSGQRRRPEAEHVRPSPAVGQPRPIALEFLAVGEPIVLSQHRLGSLEVGVAGQDHARVALAPPYKRPLQVYQAAIDRVDRIPHPQPHVGRHLVVAASGRVELATDVADPLDQCPLDVHVDVFQFHVVLKRPLLNLLADGRQSLLNLQALLGLQQPDMRQHLRMGDRRLDVLRIQPPVEAHALGELLHAAIRCLGKNATPGFLSSHGPGTLFCERSDSTTTLLL